MRLTNTFTGGKMNKGLDERIIPKGEYRDALNIEVNNSNGAGIGAVENIKGNTNISNYSFTGDTGMVTIGSIANEATNDIYWMVSGTNFDYVLRYNSTTGLTTTSLKDTKNRVLKFDSAFLITGINIINNLLFWTDDKNAPRRLNLNKTYATDGFIEDDISVIIRPPITAPQIELVTLPAEDNPSTNIELKFLQFSYRYKYENNEYSAMSPFSSIAFMPSAFDYSYGDAEFNSMKNTANAVNVRIATGTSLVKEVQVLFRDSLDSTIFIIDRFNKNKEGWADDLNPYNPAAPTIQFSNDKIYSALPNDELTRLFDNVPLKAKAQDIIGSRLVYGNYVQFFDMVDIEGVSVIPEFSLSHFNTNNTSFPLRTFKSDRDYEVGIAYLDGYGRMTTIFTSPENSVYIPPSDAKNQNNLKISITSRPPAFAARYRIFIKQNKGVYYNIFPLYYYVDGLYRYFRINRADVDKVKVGEYIIAKTGEDQSVGTGIKYKVLEVEVKEKDFLNSNELAGLYFKVRIEDPTIFSGIEIETTSMESLGGSKMFDRDNMTVSYMNQEPGNDQISIVNIPVYYGSNTSHNNLSILPGSYSGAKIYQPFRTSDNDVRIRVFMNSHNQYSISYLTPGGYQQHPRANTQLQTIPSNRIVEIFSPHAVTNSPSYSVSDFKIRFDHTSGYNQRDYWIINMQSGCTSGSTIYGSDVNSQDTDPGEFYVTPDDLLNTTHIHNGEANFYGFVIPCNLSWSPAYARLGYVPATTEVQPGILIRDREIQAGAVIRLRLADANGNETANWQPWQEWTVSRRYANLEEWFWESGAYRSFSQIDVNTGEDIGARNVFFRKGFDRSQSWSHHTPSNRASNFIRQVNRIADPSENNWSERNVQNPSWMIIKGTGTANTEATGLFNGKMRSFAGYIESEIEIIQSSETVAFETDGKENVDDVFHETNGIFSVQRLGGFSRHKGNVQDQSFSGGVPAEINLLGPTTLNNNITEENGNFNAYTFGNGVESMVIREDWNGRHIKLSPRVSTTFEDYQQERAEEALTYSGIYRAFGENSGKNNLNEFNLSLANFKYLDKAFGSIQKLNARDTDLVVFQEDKVSKVLFGKNLLSDAVGGGSVASIPEVLGTQISYAGEYGISKNPESFAKWGNDMYFTDEYRGAVCRLGLQGGIFEISSFGMSSFFRDLFIDLSGKQKIGGIDPFKDKYVLTARDVSLPSETSITIIDNDPTGG